MCGIIGIFKHEGDASIELYEGLLMLQHRGQDSAGMVTTDWEKFKEYKENGLVKDVFADKKVLESLKGAQARVFQRRRRNCYAACFLLQSSHMALLQRRRQQCVQYDAANCCTCLAVCLQLMAAVHEVCCVAPSTLCAC